MRNLVITSIVSLALILCSLPAAFGQKPSDPKPVRTWPEVIPGEGWKTCPRCQNDLQIEAAREKYQVAGHAYDPHDLSGVWFEHPDMAGKANGGIYLDFGTVPSLTPYGEQLHAATQSPTPLTNAKDGMLICDPLGYPRWFTYNYGFEFIRLPDRVLQFFDWGHTWRTIWTDGRKLPTDPPELRWAGYAVGKWEGDEFIVESSGYDDRSWLDQDRRDMKHGMPHSDEMRVEERFKRMDYDTLETSVTVIDPKVYTAPWTTHGKSELRPGTDIGEYFCVPSESNEYNHLTHEKYQTQNK
jgi:hypothetical protein